LGKSLLERFGSGGGQKWRLPVAAAVGRERSKREKERKEKKKKGNRLNRYRDPSVLQGR
jgi:hypothetical protein